VLRHVRRAVRDLSDHRAALEKQLHDSERKVKCDTCMRYSEGTHTHSHHRACSQDTDTHIRLLSTFEACV
jgi:hypothetical protein